MKSMEFDLLRLRHLVAVARAGSFSRAAEELNLTQPALSRSIASIEERYGVRLFDRGRNGARLTSTGALVLAEAEAVLRSARGLDHNLRLYGSGKAGAISLGFGPLTAALLLPQLTGFLLQNLPRLSVRTSIRPADQLMAQLMDDQIEMAFCNGWQTVTTPELISEIIGHTPLKTVVRGGHPLIGRGPVTLADLDQYPAASTIELPAGGLSGRSGALICDNFHILREAVLRSDCIWTTSPAFVASDLQCGALAMLDVSDMALQETRICLLRRRGLTLSPTAITVRDQVSAILSAAASLGA